MKTTFLLGLLTAITFGCASRQPLATTAQVRWTGPQAADGCGFFLEFNGNAYKPVNEEIIPDELQDFQTRTVRITYEFTDEAGQYSCGMQGETYPLKLRIISMNIEEE